MDIDEDALLMNVACETDIPTSLAGAVVEDHPEPTSRLPLILGLVAGLLAALTIAYLLG